MPKSTKDDSRKTITSDEPKTSLMGLKKYCREYVLRSEQKPRHELKAEIDAYLAEYDNKVEEEKQKMKDVEGVPDEDGWVTVTRTKGVTRSSQQQQNTKSKKKKDILNFYTHQRKETKNKQIQDLQERLKMEKEKINQMRQMRKFKPY